MPYFLVIFFLFYKNPLYMYIMDISSSLNILQIFLSVCHSLIIFSCIEKFFPFQLVTSVDLFLLQLVLCHK